VTQIKHLGGNWLIDGNENIDPTIQFLGTIDANDFSIRTSNIERIHILSTGQIGIGTSTPAELIDIEGKIAGSTTLRLAHSLTGSSNHSTVVIQTQGSGGGDPRIQFNIKGVATGIWAMGIDNSDQDSFKISQDDTVGTSARIKIEKAGKVFINRNLEVGSTQTQDEVQVQILAGSAQSDNIMQVGVDGGLLDEFLVIDDKGRLGVNAPIPVALVDIEARADDEATFRLRPFVTQSVDYFVILDKAGASTVSVTPNGTLVADKRDVLRYTFFMGA